MVLHKHLIFFDFVCYIERVPDIILVRYIDGVPDTSSGKNTFNPIIAVAQRKHLEKAPRTTASFS
jgi:hypothetical protein